MRKGWLIAAALAGATAGVAEGAQVRIFGVSSPDIGKWAIYAQVFDTNSVVPGQQVAGLSSISVNAVNNGGAAVTTSVNNLPRGNTPYTDPLFNPSNVGYGFWLVNSDGSVGAEPVPSGAPATGRSGAFGIAGGQYTFPDTTVPYSQLVISGVGITAGTISNDANHTSSVGWGAPIKVASGNYTPPSATSPQGLKIEYGTDTSVNLVRDTDPGPGIAYVREAASAAITVDARAFTGAANPTPTPDQTIKAAPGDANLDNSVGFLDLVALAQNYNGTARSWFQGDFNYDGSVGFLDLVILAQHYGQPVPAAGEFGGQFGSDLAAAFAAVPEPGTLGLAGVVIGGMLSGRRRRK